MDHGAQWNCRLGAIEYGSTVVMIIHPGLLGYSVKYCIREAKGEKAVKTGVPLCDCSITIRCKNFFSLSPDFISKATRQNLELNAGVCG